MSQLGVPSAVTVPEIQREETLGGAIDLCRKVAGYSVRELLDAGGWDAAQFSRWVNDHEGIRWERLTALMDLCGNDAPLLWMLQRRGYDLASLRKKESVLERELRVAKEELSKLRAERAAERRFMSDMIAAKNGNGNHPDDETVVTLRKGCGAASD